MDENQENAATASNVDGCVSLKKSAEALFIGDDPVGGGKSNLQANFLKFREQKMKERQIMKMCQQARSENRRTQEYKDNLRQKFIDTAHKYLGVPYALRYKEPDVPVAPLYLDCCGLVRQVLQDLQEDFGFIVGKWNQAYQMDTLPVVLSFEQLRPGDLIFYEGLYTSKRSKSQKHNNVHVEIFLGGETGEATIGSRYHRGKVSVFPSYKFKSTTWDLVQYHFRSLDTWLDGECRSHCCEHPWLNDALAYVEAAGKRSIFSDAAANDDVDASGDEAEDPCDTSENDHLEDHAVGRPTTAGSDCEDGTEGNEGQQQDNEDQDEIGGGGEEGESQCEPALPKPAGEDSIAGVRSPPKPANEVGVDSTFIAKGVGLTRGQPTKRAKRVSAYATAPSSKDSAKATNASSDGNVARSYYVGKSNGWKLVKAALDQRGWRQLPFDYQFTSRFGLKWVERRSQIDFRAHQPGQLVCHIPNNDIITTKLGLLTTMRDKFCKKTPGTLDMIHAPWLPDTYDLDAPAEVACLLKACEEIPAGERQPLWIYKPSCNNRGRGIRVVSGIESLTLICHGKQTNDPETTVAPLKGIVQKYLETPLLIGPEGFKFDIRCYLLIARNYPTTMAFYHPGYCRLALKPYTLGSGGANMLDDVMMHLTNASVQKKDPIYQANKDIQIQSLEAVAQKMDDCGKSASAEYIRNQLDHDIKKCMVDVLKAGNSKLLRKHGYFDLLGCDFMLSDDNKLYMLEINTNPALSLDNSVLEGLLPNVVDGALELVLETQGPDVDINTPVGDFSNRQLPSKYQLLFDEAQQWMYGGQ